ncbi:LysR substrate-binding domain-containing protein [Microbacterium sp. SSM24]|uniref:LysR substrate-binding domain-containing protein n=1 Tax=Microbacterium sp. SSM24 TaxID=2991714 RepID=UPI0022274EFB|nr:LysR substrate-binding domain-containing protein [Microbacterium sp. SSM24]MCW3493312.1 LysR substrate-binding domain-containing protein [Microbacterium sp. SSM24]
MNPLRPIGRRERQRARSLSDLVENPWVVEHVGSSVRHWTDSVCRDAGFVPRVAYESADVYLHAEIVAHGLAAGFLPNLSVRDLEGVRLVPLGAARTIDLSIRAGSETSPIVAAATAALHTASTDVRL